MKHDLLTVVDSLTSVLEQRKFLLAYSGGLDSHVLLHVMSRLPDIELRAVHIDHGLQDASPWWGRHCRDICNDLGVPLERISLHLAVPEGQSVEAYAREKRYQAFKDQLQPGEVLLTAHHQNDQAETLLIQLLRGAGGAGLSAMPMIAPFAAGHHMRPLLNCSRVQLEAYADEYQLSFVEDSSNADLRYDRNYLRHQILPQLAERWPGCYGTLSRAAFIQGETQQLLDSYVAQDALQQVGSVAGTLSVAALLDCEPARRRAILRYWLISSGFKAPSAKKLQHIISDVLYAAEDASPCVHWADVEVRRYRDDLYVMNALSEHDPMQTFSWDLTEDLFIASLGLLLRADQLGAWGDKLRADEAVLSLRFRQGGEVMRPPEKEHSISLKHIFQQFAVPPWLRERIPLVFLGDQLIMVYGVCQIDPAS
ncbi:tRNA lysidine(34) synthetase TilS [Leucothrix mucor]|uniref:tRNA lysidine(34) synthetase TilS n=1 Tax=Leucothrix mucor TaxID=45248 RepID=UPI0003B4723B|nr:tRNA lysidine(34) synthetase TilS [Leucothrix mucor]